MFEDFGKMIANIGQNVMKKTGEVAEIASLHTKVLGKKKKIEDEFQALGKEFYEAHKDETTEFLTHITAINTLYTEIAAMEEEIKALKEKLPEEEKEVAETVTEEDAEMTEEDASEKKSEEETGT